MPKFKHISLIYNPKAGKLKRDNGRIIRETAAILAESGSKVQLLPTTGPNMAGELAKDAALHSDIVAAAGGDGTLNEVLQGMAGSPTPMAVLPGGTANVLCVETRIGTRLRKAAARLETWKPKPVALGRLTFAGGETRYFFSMAGIGLDASVIRQLNPKWKHHLGKGAYWLAAFSQIGKPIEEFEARFNGGIHHGSFVLASRVRNYGGDLEIAPTIRLTDSDLEVVLFEGDRVRRYLPYFARIAKGRLRTGGGITIARTRKVQMRPLGETPIWLQVDGELAGMLPAAIDLVDQGITLLLPDVYPGAGRGPDG